MLISIVHTYSILYSKRVLQKSKSWEDGILKYYEFNKKLEVLSDDGMLVASDFDLKEKKATETGPFEVGTTSILPNGNLIIEFIDYVGVTRKNLATLMIKSSQTSSVRTCFPDKQQIRYHKNDPLIKIEDDSTHYYPRMKVCRSSPTNPNCDQELLMLSKNEQKNLRKKDQNLKRYKFRIVPGSGKVSKLLLQSGSQTI